MQTPSPTKPPTTLETDLDIDPRSWNKSDVYSLIGSLVIPRPVAWISTCSPTGVPDIAPYSYFNLAADDPPHVMFSSIGVKNTLANIRETKEFVVNLAGRDKLGELHITAAHHPNGTEKLSSANLQLSPSATVAPKRVDQAKAHLECELVWETPVANGNVVIGRVLRIHVAQTIWDSGRVAPDLYDPVVRLSHQYGALGNSFTAQEEPADHVVEVSAGE